MLKNPQAGVPRGNVAGPIPTTAALSNFSASLDPPCLACVKLLPLRPYRATSPMGRNKATMPVKPTLLTPYLSKPSPRPRPPRR